ncbi:hypothetical protein ACWDTP_14385 [Mycobacterium sp. NPDC003449]
MDAVPVHAALAYLRAHCRAWAKGVFVALSTFVAIGLTPAIPAAADSESNLRSAIAQMRQGTCAELRSDPLVEQAAEDVIRSTDSWLDHTARAVPVPDVVPVLKDLGYPGKKATKIVSSGVTDADAIKGLLLQGYASVPDCGYTDYGARLVLNQSSGYYVAAIVMAGA